MNFSLLSTVVSGAASSSSSGSTASTTTLGGLNPVVLIILYCVVIFGVMYVFSVRPQKKKTAAIEEMRKSIAVDDSVLLANGMYGKIVDITAECYIIEFGTNRGVRIPVLKQEVYAKKEPNLTNKVEEVEVPEKKSLLGAFGKKKEEKDDTLK
ncbi:MAG TPA: preprotein translocase subunit YajC [Lachnospiraceae bacterium]|nr:preprotein translocase subunit YajC [Lachnospiraceae bacterium]